MQPQPKHQIRNFQHSLRKGLLKPKTDQKLKVLLGLIIINKKKKQQQLNSLFVFFPTQQQPWHSNMMSGKDLNLFYECPAEYVHLCTQEE